MDPIPASSFMNVERKLSRHSHRGSPLSVPVVASLATELQLCAGFELYRRHQARFSERRCDAWKETLDSRHAELEARTQAPFSVRRLSEHDQVTDGRVEVVHVGTGDRADPAVLEDGRTCRKIDARPLRPKHHGET
ncbi:hypothetical protein MTO96_024414 [Rhipicephalus appendiculatus]